MMVNRPEGFKKERNDCAVRALSITGSIPYEKVHNAFAQVGRRDGHGVRSQDVLHRVCKILKLEARLIKVGGSVNKLIKEHSEGKLFCLKRKHAFSIINGVAYDLNSKKSHVQGAWIITLK